MLREKLPGGSRALFEAVVDAPGMALEDYASALGRTPSGGYWGESIRTLRQNGLIEERGGRVYLAKQLRERAAA
jgi:hypothetical protein